ncbi:MAG TPA: autotransporter-associated beta strand repeat-containing protein [Chthoniobacterales bacterium]|nr:autotransporter-associated beta strand repeat-containing protein [Chthoniobacterales bacterium]
MVAALVVGCVAPPSRAQTSQYWDINGSASGFGGTGTWDTVTPNWNDSTGTGTAAPWTNGNNAFFQGTAGTVTLTSGLNASAWNVTVGGYTFTGGELSVGSGNIAISATNGTTSVSSLIQGTAALNKTEGGNLTLTNLNTYSGGTFFGTSSGSAAGTIALGSSSTGGPGSVASSPVGTGTFTLRGTGTSSIVRSTDATARTIDNAIAFAGSSVNITFGSSTTGNLSFGGTANLGSGTRTLAIANSVTTFGGAISGSGGLSKAGSGTLTFAGATANTYTGKTLVSSGTLLLNKTAGVTAVSSTGASGADAAATDLQITSGSVRLDASNQIANTTKIGLSGGTLNLNGFSEGAAGTVGVGALTLSATSTIDFGAGAMSIIQFAALGTHTAGTVLQLINWSGVANTGGSGDRLLFSGSASDFTSRYQQSEVSFDGSMGYNTVQFADFYEVTAAPEPSTYAAGLLAFLTIGYSKRQRVAQLLKRAS